jgi:hypothetical protein
MIPATSAGFATGKQGKVTMSMSATQIRAELRKRELTYEQVGQLAEGEPLSRAMISRNIKKVASHKSARAQRAIARALGRDVKEVFGKAA